MSKYSGYDKNGPVKLKNTKKVERGTINYINENLAIADWKSKKIIINQSSFEIVFDHNASITLSPRTFKENKIMYMNSLISNNDILYFKDAIFEKIILKVVKNKTRVYRFITSKGSFEISFTVKKVNA